MNKKNCSFNKLILLTLKKKNSLIQVWKNYFTFLKNCNSITLIPNIHQRWKKIFPSSSPPLQRRHTYFYRINRLRTRLFSRQASCHRLNYERISKWAAITGDMNKVRRRGGRGRPRWNFATRKLLAELAVEP